MPPRCLHAQRTFTLRLIPGILLGILANAQLKSTFRNGPGWRAAVMGNTLHWTKHTLAGEHKGPVMILLISESQHLKSFENFPSHADFRKRTREYPLRLCWSNISQRARLDTRSPYLLLWQSARAEKSLTSGDSAEAICPTGQRSCLATKSHDNIWVIIHRDARFNYKRVGFGPK